MSMTALKFRVASEFLMPLVKSWMIWNELSAAITETRPQRVCLRGKQLSFGCRKSTARRNTRKENNSWTNRPLINGEFHLFLSVPGVDLCRKKHLLGKQSQVEDITRCKLGKSWSSTFQKLDVPNRNSNFQLANVNHPISHRKSEGQSLETQTSRRCLRRSLSQFRHVQISFGCFGPNSVPP